MQPFIKINGHPYPCPREGLGLRVATVVDAARNANAVMVGQKVGRDQQKLESLEWDVLDAGTWAQLLQEFDANFYVTVTYPDMVWNRWTTRKMYPGDRTAVPIALDPASGLPRLYASCQVELIDCGEAEETQ